MIKTLLTLSTFVGCSLCQARIVGDTSFSPQANSPAFATTHPVLCVDHGHHNLAIDDGRYQPIVGLLKSDGYQIQPINANFNLETLQRCQILYISGARALGIDGKENQSSAFSHQEIDHLKAWVSEGGALLIATDHPNMAQAAEPLIEAFAVTGSQATTRDPNNTIASLRDPGVIIFKTNPDSDKTGIFSGRNSSERVKKVVFFDGQSLSSSKGISLLNFQESASDEAPDQRHRTAFGRAAMVLIKDGKGRVVITGDATIFTSKMEDSTGEKLGINREGNDNVQLALNTFHWLSKLIDR